MGKDSAAGIELGRSFHQEGTFNVQVYESDFVSLWDDTIMQRSLAERKLLEAHKSEVMNLGKEFEQCWFIYCIYILSYIKYCIISFSLWHW